MYLGASLRQKKCSLQQKAFFRLTRPEYLFSPFSQASAFGRFEFPQGIKWNQDDTNLSWVQGQVMLKFFFALGFLCSILGGSKMVRKTVKCSIEKNSLNTMN